MLLEGIKNLAGLYKLHMCELTQELMLKLVEDHYPMPLGGVDSGDKGKDAKGKATKKGTKSGKRKRGLANGDAALSLGQQPNGQQGDGEPQSGQALGYPNVHVGVVVILTPMLWVCIA